MKEPMDQSKKVGLTIIGLLPLVMIGRGIYAFIVGEVYIAPRFIPPVTLTGSDAYLAGLGYVFLGLIIVCGMTLELGATKKQAAIGGLVMLLGAITSFYLSLS